MKFFPVLTLTVICTLASGFVRATPAEDALPGHLRAGHPRLLFTDDQLRAALDAAKTDPLRAALHQAIIARATAILPVAPIRHELIGPRLLDKSRSCIERVLTCAMAYRLTGDTRFSDRAKRELLTAAAFKDWNPSHFLDVAEMSFAFAIGYDWLYPQLAPAERESIRRAMLDYGLSFARAAYAPNGPTDKRVWFVTAHHNWNQVCNGGLLAAALALADEEPALAKLVVDGARKSLPLAVAAYEPDGAYPEGPGYWGYGTTYNVLAVALLESALGTDLGLSDDPGFSRTVLYRLYVQSPTGLGFNYADGGAGLSAQPAYTWLAERFRQPVALAHSRELLEHDIKTKRRDRETDRFFALNAVWYPKASDAAASSAGTPLDAKFRGPAELAIFRSAWADPRALFVGFKAGHNDVNHAHLDLGSFVLDADDVRWAEDLGPDNYNLPGYFSVGNGERWKYYRLNNHSHNTLTPDHALQAPKAVAPLAAFASTPARAFAVADLTAAYPGKASRLIRGVALLDRARVLVQDEGTGIKPGSSWTWRMLTPAKVKLDDAHHATLTLEGRTLRAEILEPAAARFTAEPARPPTAEEMQNKGVTELAANYAPDGSEARLVVLLTPVGDHWPSALPAPAVTPLADWK